MPIFCGFHLLNRKYFLSLLILNHFKLISVWVLRSGMLQVTAFLMFY